jgi:TonB family protein
MNLRPAVPLLAALLLSPRPGLPQDPPQDAPKMAGVDVPAPKRVKSVAPQYPPEAQAMGMRGIVILELVVGPDGKVVSARVTRSVPPFDDAALSAVRQWEYEITKVEGNPVTVILTVPIEFKMRLPEMAREEGIPELRQGVVPAYPIDAKAAEATVTAEVTLDPDGHVAEAHIKEGDSPWAESLIQALRTWRFSPVEGGDGMVFEVRADFASSKGGPHVDLRSSGARRITPPAPPADASPAPDATDNAPRVAPAVPASPPAPPSPLPVPAAPSPAPAIAPPPASPSPAPASPRPTAPPEELIRNPAGGTPAPAPALPAPSTGTPPDGTAAASAVPAVAATPPPPQPGISAVRDVTLAPGVPDLMKGRRPVSPPFARMQGISGTVDVHFAVDAAGSATVREVNGPEPLKEAARQTVASWSFRRSTPERLFLAATFEYKGDTAMAAVRPQE